MKDLIKRILKEQTKPSFQDKVMGLVKKVGYNMVKSHPLTQLVKLVVGATPTKARLVFPKKGWETTAVKALEFLGIVTGTYKTLGEANEFFKQVKNNGIILEEVLIGSHGSPGNLLITQHRDSVDFPGHKIKQPKRYYFNTSFLKSLKSVVNSSTKVYFTACKGAEKLTMLKEASDYLGCECYACMGNNAFSFGCDDSNWSCNANTGVDSYSFAHELDTDEKNVVSGEELRGYRASQAYTDKVNKFYEEKGVCQEQPNTPFNWVTLFG